MRILILGSKEYPVGTNMDDALPSGGIEFYVQDLVSQLAGIQKMEVAVITRRFSKTSAYEKNGNLEVFRVPWIKGFFFRNLTFNFMAFLKALRIDFDLLNSHGPVATFFGLLLSKAKKTPVIATPHGLSLEQPQYPWLVKRFFSILEKIVYSKAHYVIFLSEEEKEGFRKKLGFFPGKYKVIYAGIDAKRFESGNGVGIKEEFNLGDSVIITFVGRLIDVKGVKYFIEALSGLKGGFSVLIVGEGVQRKELEKMVFRLNLGNVIFTGLRSDIPDILAATDIFVLPSLSEGTPIALLEAMAAGKACVVTDIGLPVEEGKTALVVKPADAKSLGEALKALLANKQRRKSLGENAKKKAKSEFTWGKSMEIYLQLFEELN